MEIRDIANARAFSDHKLNKVNLFQSSRFFCDLYCLEPGQEQKVHTHDGEDKIYAIMEGEAEVVIGTETAVVGEGQVVFAPAGIDHGIRNASSGRVVSMVFMAPHPSWSE